MSTSAIEPTVVFMGTPEFAVPSLRALAEGPYMVTVVTQPDRPTGRGARVTPPPVKVAAEELGLQIIQPASLRDPAFRERMAALAPDVTVLVAYGEYVAPALLDLPRRGSINLHPSLLPRWRGSTPIQSAILAGDSETGVSIIRMDRGLDTGPIIAQRATPIGPEETHPALSARLAAMGAELLAEVLPLWLRGEVEAVPQPEQGATLTRTLSKEDGLLDWTMGAEELARRVRALQPWPGTYTYWGDRMIKVLSARPAEGDGTKAQPGAVVVLPGEGRGQRVVVQAGEGLLELRQVQLAGKAPIEARALLSGYPQIAGSVLGPPAASSTRTE
ncbi:MAG TPA: methionyl-tRNA formyltransferase [Chloroflexia bacterium]|nr:methionyl-tRNA formyltransferase [Chloroflexia bacterium]